MIKEVKTGDIVVAGIKDGSIVVAPLLAQEEREYQDGIFKIYVFQIKIDYFITFREDELSTLWSYTEEKEKRQKNWNIVDDFYSFAKAKMKEKGGDD